MGLQPVAHRIVAQPLGLFAAHVAGDYGPTPQATTGLNLAGGSTKSRAVYIYLIIKITP